MAGGRCAAPKDGVSRTCGRLGRHDVIGPNDPLDMADKQARRAAASRHWDAINGGLIAEYEALLARKRAR